MEKRTNIGYEIIECIELGGVEYVLGVNETAPNPYVTWRSSPDRQNYYYWGHYMNSLLDARKDLYERVIDEARNLIQKVEKRMEYEAEKKIPERTVKGQNRDMER